MPKTKRGEPVDEIRLTVNGKERSLPPRTSVADLLRRLDLTPGTVVVERNREIVQRELYDEVTLEEGDSLELVHFVGGG